MDYSIKIKRFRTSRRIRLRILHNGEVILTAPTRAPESALNSFIKENEEWIQTKLKEIKSKQATLTEQRESILFRGQNYELRLEISGSKKPSVNIKDSQLLIINKTEDHHEVRILLEKFFRREAEKRFKERVPLLADLVNREVKTVTIRDQRTRWGSCSSRNTISLNWRLIMVPDDVSDYVIYHELAHLTHMNHSNRFWKLVSDYDPAYKEHERYLKKHQKLLQF